MCSVHLCRISALFAIGVDPSALNNEDDPGVCVPYMVFQSMVEQFCFLGVCVMLDLICPFAVPSILHFSELCLDLAPSGVVSTRL